MFMWECARIAKISCAWFLMGRAWLEVERVRVSVLVVGLRFGGMLVLQALKGIREKVQLATKFANFFDEKGNFDVRGDPEYVRQACEASLKRLDVDYIDLYYQHRVDTKVPIEITVRR